MARGGYRPGAGRPKGAKSRKVTVAAKRARPAAVKPVVPATEPRADGEQAPLDYMLAVMNDPTADAARRDRMAIAAAPFMHARVADDRLGKKDVERAAAAKVIEGGKFAPRQPPKLVVNNA